MAGKISVQEIVVNRLIERIESENKLPWQRPFQQSCLNWYSKREYTGINKILLSGGEYITVNQLKEYNAKHKTTFWFEKGTRWEIVTFYTKFDKLVSPGEAASIRSKGYGHTLVNTEKGLVKRSWLLRYYRVYNILHLKDKEGNTLQPHLGNTLFENHTSAEEIVDFYVDATGVTLAEGTGGAYYTDRLDTVVLPAKTYFKGQEAYYRVLFHELVHSTGVKTRLNRSCFVDYHKEKKERSKEELVAEIGGLLLASEAGFRDDTEWANNSIEYVAGWCAWMKDNKNDVINGMIAAEKAKNFILSGGVDASGGGEAKTSDKDTAPVVGSSVGEVEDDSDIPSSSEPVVEPTVKEKKEKPVKVTAIKSAKKAFEYFLSHLDGYFTVGVTTEQRVKILASLSLDEFRHLTYYITKVAPAKSKTKRDLMELMIIEVDKRLKRG